MLEGKTVLVTGCSGLLGPWLCDVLIADGAKVIGLDKQFPRSSRIHTLAEKISFVEGDVQDGELIASLLKKCNISFVYHLAAQALVGVAVADPVGTFRDNIAGTWSVLESVRQRRDRYGAYCGVIVASSDKAYGDQTELPYMEDFPLKGRFPYDVSKSCADLIAQSYFHTYRLPIAIVRCGNLYGAGDLNFSRIVPGTILSLLRGERPIIRSDGSPVRDYIYVHDAARAYVELSAFMSRGSDFDGHCFNISNDEPVTVLEVVDLLREILGRADLTPEIQNNATREIQAQFLNSAKVRNSLDWAPQYTLRRGLNETVGWYREYLDKAEEQNFTIGAESVLV